MFSILNSVKSSSARSVLNGLRRASTAPPSGTSSRNLPLYLLGAGTAGIGAYWYLDHSSKQAVLLQTKSPLDPENFINFRLKRIEGYNHDTAKFIFELPNNEASLLPVASCVVVKAADPEALVDAKGKPIIRPYTPISPSDEKGELAFLIKKYPTGNASKYIHSLQEGDSLAIKGPIAKFPYKENEFEKVALIGGGSGITPLYQVLEHALSSPSNKTHFTLLYGNLTPQDILLKEELDALERAHPSKLDIVYLVDKAKAEDAWTGPKGFITKELLQKHVGGADLGEKVKIFVCGPPGQVEAIAGKKAGMKQGDLGGVLKELGYKEDQVFKF